MRKLLLIALVILLAMPCANAITTTFRLPGCTTSFQLNATDKIEIHPGETGYITATVWDINCGISHTMLDIEGIPKEWYTREPDYIASIIQPDIGNFRLNITIPEDTGYGEYEGQYVAKPSERWFRFHNLTIFVTEPEPEPEPEPVTDVEPVILVIPQEPAEEEQVPAETLLTMVVLLIAFLCYWVMSVKKEGKKKKAKKK